MKWSTHLILPHYISVSKRKETCNGCKWTKMKRKQDGRRYEWIDGWVDECWLAEGVGRGVYALHIGIDPQEGPSKTRWHLWVRRLQRPGLGIRHRKRPRCWVWWGTCHCLWWPLSYFLYRSTRLRCERSHYRHKVKLLFFTKAVEK